MAARRSTHRLAHLDQQVEHELHWRCGSSDVPSNGWVGVAEHDVVPRDLLLEREAEVRVERRLAEA